MLAVQCDEIVMVATAGLAERTGVRLHTHLAETADEEAFCLATFGCRPLDYLQQCGWLHDRTWLAHGVHFDLAEIEQLARSGTCVTHCPCSNQILASGTCLVCEMEQAGMAVGLGVDGSASNNSSNMIQEVRAAFLLQRSRYGVDRVSHLDALRWATEGSAACIGRPELGRIAVGMQADLALFTLDELRFSGALGSGCRPGRVRCASSQPGYGRRPVGGGGWRHPRTGYRGADRTTQCRGESFAHGIKGACDG